MMNRIKGWFQYQASWRQIIWAAIGLVWYFLLRNSAANYPDAMSSFNVPYIWLLWVPVITVLFHVAYPCRVSWFLVFLLYFFSAGYVAITDISITFEVYPTKSSIMQVVLSIIISSLIIIVPCSFFWWLRPVERGAKGGNGDCHVS